MIIVSRNIRYIRQMYLIFLETRIISRLGIFTSVPWGGASNDRGLSKSTIFIVCYSLYVDYRQDIHRLHEKRGHSILDMTVTYLVTVLQFFARIIPTLQGTKALENLAQHGNMARKR